MRGIVQLGLNDLNPHFHYKHKLSKMWQEKSTVGQYVFAYVYRANLTDSVLGRVLCSPAEAGYHNVRYCICHGIFITGVGRGAPGGRRGIAHVPSHNALCKIQSKSNEVKYNPNPMKSPKKVIYYLTYSLQKNVHVHTICGYVLTKMVRRHIVRNYYCNCMWFCSSSGAKGQR